MRALALVVASLTLVCPARADDTAARLVAAATAQIGVTTGYDGSYRRLAYPNGDVPAATGVCTDVLIRAYRALGIDLQARVHEDMRRAFAAYPQRWGLRGPDRSIDHRRVPNLQAYFARHGTTLAISDAAGDYAAGDIVTWDLGGGIPHIGLVSDRRVDGRPLVIHNIGAGVQLEDILFEYTITGHYRYP